MPVSRLSINDYTTTFNAKSQNLKLSISSGNNFTFEYGSTYLCEFVNFNKISNIYQNPSSFDYEKYMFSQKIIYNVKVENCQLIKNNRNPYYLIKNLSYLIYQNNIIKYPVLSEYINALVFGINDLTQEQKLQFSNVGVIHIFAISGTHITLITTYIQNLVGEKNKILVVIVLLIYSIVAQNSYPVNRACFSKVLNLTTPLSEEKIYVLLFLSNLVFNPFCILHLGFILSYLISGSLLLLKRTTYSNKYHMTITYFIILPILINLNYTFNGMFLVANFLIIPLVTKILLPLSFVITIFDFRFLTNFFQIIVTLLERLSGFIDLFTINIGYINPILMVLYFLVLLFWLSKKIIFKHLIMILGSLLIIMSIQYSFKGSITFIDVGQAKAILINLPLSNHQILIDTGSERSAFELQKYLAYQGIDKIEDIIITHNHDDHYGAIEALENNFKIGNIYSSQKLDVAVTNLIILKNGDSLDIRDLQLNILAPTQINDDPNLNSLVISSKIGNMDWLFTGDTTSEIEQQLVKNYPNLKITHLDVAHHGSNTSSSESFIKYFHPKYCYIQAGKNNIHNHPSKEVVNTLTHYSCDIKQTDIDGAITIFFD